MNPKARALSVLKAVYHRHTELCQNPRTSDIERSGVQLGIDGALAECKAHNCSPEEIEGCMPTEDDKQMLRKYPLVQFSQAFPEDIQNCLWYCGEVATIIYQGKLLVIESIGDVVASLFIRGVEEPIAECRDKSGSGDFYRVFSKFISNDEELARVLSGTHPKYAFEFVNNNWLECFVMCEDGSWLGDTFVLGSSMIYSAIGEAIALPLD